MMTTIFSSELTRRFSLGALASLAVKVAGMGINFLAMLVFARLLGVEEFGVYAYVWGWLGLAMVVVRGGFDTTVLRFVASYSGTGDWSRAKGVFDYASKVTLFSALIGSMAMVVAALMQDGAQAESRKLAFLIAAIVLPISVRSSILQSAIRALRHPGLADVPELIVRPVVAGIFLILWYVFITQRLDARYALIGQLLGVSVTVSVAFYIWRICAASSLRTEPLKDRQSEWLSVSIPLLLISAFQFVLHQMDVVMIGYIRGTEEVGAYVPATRIADLVGFGLVVVSAMMAPMISSLFASGDRYGLESVVRLAALMASAFALILFVIIVVLRAWLLGLFGEGFASGELPLVILSLGQLVNVLIGPVGYLTTMTGHHAAAGKVVAGSAALNLILNLLLIPAWGIVGASIATASALAVSHTLLGIYVWRKLRLNPTAVGRLRPQSV